MNNVPKFSVEIDGQIFDADNVDVFLLAYEKGLWRVQIITKESVKSQKKSPPIQQPIEEIPEMTQPILNPGQFHTLQEDELVKLHKQSNLRKTTKIKNKAEKESQVITIESEEHDIVNDVNSFSLAIEEVAKKETELANDGWTFDDDIEKPMYIFTNKDSQIFKIRTKIHIIKY